MVGTGAREPINALLLVQGTFRALANSMHNSINRGAHVGLSVIVLEEESRRVALSSGLYWSPRSEGWSV